MIIEDDPRFKAFGLHNDAIKLLIAETFFGAAVCLIYIGIDSLTHLGRDPEKDSVGSNDFKKWVNKYFVLTGETIVTSDEWWAARCAALHTLGGISVQHSKYELRRLTYMSGFSPDVMYKKEVSNSLVSVEVSAMHRAYIEGQNKFLMDIYANPELLPLLEERVNQLFIRMRVA
jgi:hypothetical protein